MLWSYLGLTILFELPVFLLFWRRQGWWQALVFCVLVNGFTNPLLNLAIVELGWNVYLLEIAVVVIEALAALVLFKPTLTKAFLFSFAANLLSYSMGLSLQLLGCLQ